MDHSRTRELIRDVPDFPKPGIVFKDITPVLADPVAFREVLDDLAAYVRTIEAQVVAGIESRGFIMGAPVAAACSLPFVPIRKQGKLPYATITEEYDLEYGTAAIEAHVDAVQPGQRVVIMDDLLATGGTAAASVRLMERLGARVCGLAFVVELGFLNGRAALPGLNIHTLVRYD
ncbi:MAG: adenine phosphoribosyltransferase [Chthonomonadales bacterium]|nr:adenine phosphoribosyltransferase [Chthonomonadales bacterium]